MQETIKALFTEDEWNVITQHGAPKLKLTENMPLKLEKEQVDTENADKQ